MKNQKTINENEYDIDWIGKSKANWSIDIISDLYVSGEIDSVRIVGWGDTEHLEGAALYCDEDVYNKFSVGGVYRILSTSLTDRDDYKPSISTLDCGWCQESVDSIGYDCKKDIESITLTWEENPDMNDFFMFSEDWVELEPVIKTKDINESNDFDWVEDVVVGPLDSKYFIVNERSNHSGEGVTAPNKGEWILMEVLGGGNNNLSDKDDNYRVNYRILEMHTNPDSDLQKVPCLDGWIYLDELKKLLGIGPDGVVSENPWWFPHNGDTSNLPKDKKYTNCKNLNESNDLDWLSNTNVDFIKLGSVFIDNEDERFIIINISPSSLTIKSLDFPEDKHDTTIKSNWTKEEWLELIDSGEVKYSHNIHLNESNDLDWIKDTEVGDRLTSSPDLFFRTDDDMFYTLDQLGHDSEDMSEMIMAELALNYGYRWSDTHEGWYHRDEVQSKEEFLNHYDDDIKKFNELNEDFRKKYVVESSDFDWIEDQRPNPFLGRDIKFYIDESPTEEQSKLIWDLLVESGATDGRSIKIYNRVNKLMGHKGKFIIIDYDGNFTYNISDIGGYIETNKISAGNILKFSDIFSNDGPSDPNDLNTFIKESDDFDWAKGPIEYDINSIIGKTLYYRDNNFNELEDDKIRLSDVETGQLRLGSYNKDKAFRVVDISGDKAVIRLDGDKKGVNVTYSTEEVEQYVNLGIWLMKDDNGQTLNDWPYIGY
tara:strand:+ start:101 stop:2230 length:2130 start_codon:yes stop_codon:yes gene_type:complete